MPTRRQAALKILWGSFLALSLSASVALSDPVPLRVIDEVKVGDLVLIANKAPAFATIAEIQHARRRMRAGTMSIKLDHVTLVTGQTQKLRGATATKGGPVDLGLGPRRRSISGPCFILPALSSPRPRQRSHPPQ